MPTKTRFVQCGRCKGEGSVWEKIYNPGNCEWAWGYVHCMQMGCNNGIVDMEEYYQSWQLSLSPVLLFSRNKVERNIKP